MTARQALSLLVVATVGAVVLHGAGATLPAPPLAEPARLAGWWTGQGTPAAVLSVARIVGMALCCYLALISLLGAVASLTLWRWTHTLAIWVATPALRRMIAGGTLAAAMTSTYTAAAAPVAYVVTDIGEAQATAALGGRCQMGVWCAGVGGGGAGAGSGRALWCGGVCRGLSGRCWAGVGRSGAQPRAHRSGVERSPSTPRRAMLAAAARRLKSASTLARPRTRAWRPPCFRRMRCASLRSTLGRTAR